MMTDAQLLAALSTCATALGTAIWYLIRRSDARIEQERAERERVQGDERAERTRLIEVERQARAAELARSQEMFLRLYKEERDSRDSFMRSIEEARQRDRHDLRDELAPIAQKQAAHELYCAREYVSYPRLTEALRPIVEGQERIFEKLDGKADKEHRSVGS